MTAELLETDDIQGLIVRGYGSLHAAAFLLVEVIDPELARRYLQAACARVNTARVSPDGFALQLAFTAPGLERLGVPADARVTFSREFLEGMDDDVRAEALGDRGDNDPTTWQWGRSSASDIHAMVMVYAANQDKLTTHLDTELKALAGAFRVVRQQDTTTLDDHKEHFGWRDGLSMPNIEGVPADHERKKQQQSWTTPLRAGEFVLGYPNEYASYSECPTAAAADDPAGHLPLAAGGVRKDLGRNGTYLVYRQLTQDVLKLWSYLADHSREPGADPAAKAIALGAKMVGRWPNGAPLVTSPDADDRAQATENRFLYDAADGDGLRCPLGAHVRRANPRDVLALDREPADSIVMVRKHQMIRRGRPFGRPVSARMDPREILAARGQPDPEIRGLHFICLVGHINRQFEFVQRAWMQSANFAALFKDADPISAARRAAGDKNANDEFTCQAEPVRRKYKQLPQFTRLVGGAYFFLPGLAALRFIARAPASRSSAPGS
ncbi:MAG TPA: hypothetical protein VGF94_05745 [Kofleriaceae bacterium]|jgi:Dyp-type peroxidase family